jgi:DNA (cytosine-5)-methyltransferase 1
MTNPLQTVVTVTDMFCGAGGSSQGAVAAGTEVRMAANHWDLAIRTHNTNFPDVDHDLAASQHDPRAIRYRAQRAQVPLFQLG